MSVWSYKTSPSYSLVTMALISFNTQSSRALFEQIVFLMVRKYGSEHSFPKVKNSPIISLVDALMCFISSMSKVLGKVSIRLVMKLNLYCQSCCLYSGKIKAIAHSSLMDYYFCSEPRLPTQ